MKNIICWQHAYPCGITLTFHMLELQWFVRICILISLCSFLVFLNQVCYRYATVFNATVPISMLSANGWLQFFKRNLPFWSFISLSAIRLWINSILLTYMCFTGSLLFEGGNKNHFHEMLSIVSTDLLVDAYASLFERFTQNFTVCANQYWW